MNMSMTMSSTISLTLAKRSASERSELAGAEERWRERFTRKSVDFRERAAAVFRFGRRVCGRRSRTLSRGPGSCGAGRLRTARQRGGLLGSGEDADGREHLPLSDTVAAGLPGSVECRRCVSTGSRNTNKEALLPEDGGRVDSDGCGGWRGAAAGCGAEDDTLITPLDRMRVCARLAGCSLE